MPYLPHLRATFKGEFKDFASAEPYERWNTSLAFKYGGSMATASLQGLADDLRADFSKMVGALLSTWTSNTYFTEVRLDSIGVDGKITRDAVFSLVDNGGSTTQYTPVLPPSCAVVATLDTKIRGRSRFGRMYLPILGTRCTAEGVISTSDQQQILNGFKTFVQDASNAPGVDDGFAAVVASGIGGGSLNEVQEVRIGRAVDTMRSRRRSLDESYLRASVSA